MLSNRKHEKGNILVSSLVVMLAMNLLAVTLVQTSMREYKMADFKTMDSTTFYLAESCIDDMVAWFKGFSTPPTVLPYTITESDLSSLYNGEETDQMLNQLERYSYNCTTTSINVITTEASESGVGENVGVKDTYGLSGDLTPTYYYEIDSYGNGPSNSQKNLMNIVAVEY